MPRVCLRAGLSKELLGADKTEIMQDDISVIKVIVMRFAGFFLCIVSVFAQEMERRMEQTIGMRIKECRVKMGMTQEELAEALVTKKSTVSAYENDKIDIKISILKQIAGILGTTVGYLSEGVDPGMGLEISRDALQLLMLYQSIQNKELRKACVEQVRALAQIRC